MAKSQRVVVEHLENLARDVLERYPHVIAVQIKGRRGIYALYRRDRLYYVGLATNLLSRLKQHLKDQHAKSWDRFSVYVTVHDEHMRELESLLLRIGAPKGNKRSGKFIKSTNLRPSLNRGI